MRKGEATREAILAEALSLSVLVGLEGISLGDLATRLNMSKSGLFAHFKSKEALQLAVLEAAIEQFKQVVVAPAMAENEGAARLRALFTGYLDWIRGDPGPGGCPFVVFAQEFDDQEGAVRELLVRSQCDWRALLERNVSGGVRSGEFRRKLDAKQVVFELVGAALAYQTAVRLLDEPGARRRACAAFERALAH